MAITLSIVRADIYHIVEGYTVMLSQHNGGTPDFASLWADQGERKKLDVFYREAIADLEQALTRYLRSTTATFALTQEGNDYTLTIYPSALWPEQRLSGLLGNHVQNYLVHAVLAGWLNDFPGLQAPDYAAMGAGDLASIESLLLYRVFDFAEAERGGDIAKPSPEEGGTAAGERTADSDKPDASGEYGAAGERTADSAKPDASGEYGAAGERTADSAKPDASGEYGKAGERTADSSKPDASGEYGKAGERKADDVVKSGGGGSGYGGSRRQDNAWVRICRCGDVNWGKIE